jgi:hypothetical protein
MGAPKRIQRKRVKGWKMPPNAVYVGRPTEFGNPFPVDVYGIEGALELYREWLYGRMSAREMSELSHYGDLSLGNLRRRVLPHLVRGKDLACWCALDQPCHADILLALANRKGK